jgi:hypothetical protein
MAMLTHNQIWTAIDRLAARAKLSPSGLAKKAGLDPTTFNKSKRVTPEGRPRWPSTESVAKALQATGTKFDTFVTLITDGGKTVMQNVPLIGFAQAGGGGFFDDGGFPVGKGWDEIAFPAVTDEHAYALEISGDSMKPAYRAGDTIIVHDRLLQRNGEWFEGDDPVIQLTPEGTLEWGLPFFRGLAALVVLKGRVGDDGTMTVTREPRGWVPRGPDDGSMRRMERFRRVR